MTILSVELLALCIAAFPRGELPGILLDATAHVGGGIVLLLPIATRIWRLRHGRLGLDNLRTAKGLWRPDGHGQRGGGLAATDPKLVCYGALTATFHTGIGCLGGPSPLFLIVPTSTE
jgi:Malonate/sodium symporter MadM subunit